MNDLMWTQLWCTWHLDSDAFLNILRGTSWWETFNNVTTERGVCSKGGVYFYEGFTHVLRFKAGTSLHKYIFKLFDERVSAWLSVRERYAIVSLPPLSIQAVSSHLPVLSSYSFRLSFLPFQTPGEACESIICHWVIKDCTYMGIGHS